MLSPASTIKYSKHMGGLQQKGVPAKEMIETKVPSQSCAERV